MGRPLVALHIGVFDDSHLWMKEAKELGYTIVATHPMDITEKYYYNDVKDYIDYFYIVKYQDTGELVEIARKHNVSMTLTHPCTNDANLASAVVNSALNLKGIKEHSAKQCLSKYDFHLFLEKHDLPRTKWNYKYEDVKHKLSDLEYPCIVKPNYGGGSAGIKKIYDAEELRFFMQLKEEGYHLSRGDFYNVQSYTRAKYLIGANSAVKNGELIIFAHYTKDMYCLNEQLRQPYFYYEEGVYSRFIENITPETHAELQRCITELGIENGAVRFDLFLDEDFNLISIIELNLRPGSSNSATCFHKVYGYNTSKELVKLNTDLPVDFTPTQEPEYDYMFTKNFRFNPGKIRRIEWPEWSENVHHFSSTLKAGDTIPAHWDASVAHKTGQLLLLGKDYDSMMAELDKITRSIQIEYD
jgi:biotin carboxylase